VLAVLQSRATKPAATTGSTSPQPTPPAKP
jgi:hypothetical protein